MKTIEIPCEYRNRMEEIRISVMERVEDIYEMADTLISELYTITEDNSFSEEEIKDRCGDDLWELADDIMQSASDVARTLENLAD